MSDFLSFYDTYRNITDDEIASKIRLLRQRLGFVKRMGTNAQVMMQMEGMLNAMNMELKERSMRAYIEEMNKLKPIETGWQDEFPADSAPKDCTYCSRAKSMHRFDNETMKGKNMIFENMSGYQCAVCDKVEFDQESGKRYAK